GTAAVNLHLTSDQIGSPLDQTGRHCAGAGPDLLPLRRIGTTVQFVEKHASFSSRNHKIVTDQADRSSEDYVNGNLFPCRRPSFGNVIDVNLHYKHMRLISSLFVYLSFGSINPLFIVSVSLSCTSEQPLLFSHVSPIYDLWCNI